MKYSKKIKISISETVFFFISYLTAQRPNLSHLRGESLTHPMLITEPITNLIQRSLVTRLSPKAQPRASVGFELRTNRL